MARRIHRPALAGGGAFPPPDDAGVRFVVLAAPRTGSNWLCTLLDSHPEVLCHHEIFNPEGLHYALRLRGGGFDLGTVAERDRDPEAVLGRVWQERRGHRAVGFKLNRGQDPRVFRRVLADAGVKKLLLRRSNRIRTFVSEQIADRTGRWESYTAGPAARIRPEADRGPARLRVDPEELCAAVAVNERYYGALEEAVQVSSQALLTLTYERLAALAAEHELRRALDFLGVRPDPGLLTGATRKQNPYSLPEMIENFAELALALSGSDLEADLYAEDP